MKSTIPCLGRCYGCLQHIGGLRALGPLYNVKLDVFTFLEAFKPVPLQSRIVDEDVFAAIETDESKPLPIVEPLHRSFCLHKTPPFLNGHGQPRPPGHKTAVETRLDDKSRTWRVESTGTCTSIASLTGPIMWRINRAACTTVLIPCQEILSRTRLLGEVYKQARLPYSVTAIADLRVL
jgi:hypothetical protein